MFPDALLASQHAPFWKVVHRHIFFPSVACLCCSLAMNPSQNEGSHPPNTPRPPSHMSNNTPVQHNPQNIYFPPQNNMYSHVSSCLKKYILKGCDSNSDTRWTLLPLQERGTTMDTPTCIWDLEVKRIRPISLSNYNYHLSSSS